MKKQLILVVLTLMMATFACSIQNIEMKTIEEQEVVISEALPNNLEETALVFQMTGGEFSLRPGADMLVNGSIIYNVEQWEPEFTRSDNRFMIKQVNPLRISGIPVGDVINTWDLVLTNTIPLDLKIEGGASKNDFDLSGLQLTMLDITQGASETNIRFDVPNPIILEEFTFKTGASSAKIYGLGNANFDRFSMSAGAGDYTLDFSGVLLRDSSVEIKAGISNLTIIIPADMKAVINNNGTVSNFNTEGTWLVTDDTYSTLVESGALLTIDLEMAVGNVNLIYRE